MQTKYKTVRVRIHPATQADETCRRDSTKPERFTIGPNWSAVFPHPLDPKKEVRVMSCDYGPELGRATTAVIRVMRTGRGWLHPDNEAQ